jgi:hypothetical protein
VEVDNHQRRNFQRILQTNENNPLQFELGKNWVQGEPGSSQTEFLELQLKVAELDRKVNAQKPTSRPLWVIIILLISWPLYHYGKHYLTGRKNTVVANPKTLILAATLLKKVNFRQEPNAQAAIIKTLPAGEKGVILEKKLNWVKLRIGETEGWVLQDFIEAASVLIKPTLPSRI